MRKKRTLRASANVPNKSGLLANEQGASVVTLTFPWAYELLGVGEETGNEYGNDNMYAGEDGDIASMINKAFKADAEFISELAEYAPDNLGLTGVKLMCDGDRIVCQCQSNHELNNEEIETLKDYISGQMSDGYGEGFEQESIGNIKDQEAFEEDYGDDDEFGDDENYDFGRYNASSGVNYENVNYEVYVHLWYNNDMQNYKYLPTWEIGVD